MPKSETFRKIPVEITAVQWFENGDHPHDRIGELLADPIGGGRFARQEGAVVRYYRRPGPEYAGTVTHESCGRLWHDHGWIDTLEGGHAVCPGDWIITGVQGERYDNVIFVATGEIIHRP